MKLDKIFEIISTDFSQSTYSKPFGKPQNPIPNTGLRGSETDPRVQQGARAGTFSQVRQNKNDPHTITKRSKFPRTSKGSNYIGDVFGEFVEFLDEENAFGNTYMPKVYNFKVITDSEGKEVYKYKIEKLNEMRSLSKKQVEFLAEKLFEEPENVTDGVELAAKANNLVGDYVNKGRTSYMDMYVKDEELQSAAAIILRFVRIRNRTREDRQTLFDRGTDNIMYRNTPYGPQLVFADPVFDKKAY